jgi:pimeloyl-ACP methyl ester carboxylesterase
MWVVVLAAAAVGLAVQAACTRRDRWRLPAPGAFVEGLHVRQIGSDGPAVVFEAGIAATCLNWALVQHALSGKARTCSYDRAGLGWSRPAHGKRSLRGITDDLHTVIHALALPRPVVLVGHSFGTFVVRMYAHRFPDDVAALVLIDPVMADEFVDPAQSSRGPGLPWAPKREARRWQPRRWRTRFRLWRAAFYSHIAGVLASFGLARLGLWGLLRRGGGNAGPLLGLSATLRRIAAEVAKLPPDVVRLLRTRWSEPRFFRELATSVLSFPACAAEVVRHPVPASVPIVVLSGAHQTVERLRAHRALATRHVVVEGSAHWIHLDQPALVAQVILDAAGRHHV